ncbi:hypothetical protein B0J17DRAFT_724325 [Rhizoctonia solani]|nr:hypothetical protein B0J17DRAFT_724325 [Rhizoctonia solani]
MTWKQNDSDTTAVNLDLVSGSSTYRAKKGLSDFKDYFNSTVRGLIHVLVDQDPSIRILLATKSWSRLFSLARVIENETVIVLKGVDGTLYHAQHVVGKLIDSTKNMKCEVSRLNQENTRTRIRNFVRAEDKRRSPSKWLIEISSASLSMEPSFDNSLLRPKIHYKSRFRPSFPLGSSASVGSVAASSMRTNSQGSGTGGGSDATRRVKEMVERLENERKEAEKKEKEKKGFFRSSPASTGAATIGSMRTTSRGSGTRGDSAEVSYWKDIFGRAEKEGEVEKREKDEGETGEKGNKGPGSLAVSPARQTPQRPDTSGESDIPRQLTVVETFENYRPIQAIPQGPTTSGAHEEIPLTGNRVKRWSRSLRA